MSTRLSAITNLARMGVLSALVLLLALGCSGKGSPTSPDLTPAVGNTIDAFRGSGQADFPPRTHGSANQASYAPNEVLVVLNDPVPQPGIAGVLSAWPLSVGKTIRCRWANVYRLTITDGTPVEDMVSRLKADPLVRMAEPNHIYRFLEAPHWPNDPLWESDDPGTSPRDSRFDQWGPAMIGADVVWNEYKGSDVVVAVIDTGVRFDHEDLNANVWINEDEDPDNGTDDDDNGWIDDWWGWDCALDNNNPWDQGYSYHGSACSGVVAAVQDNMLGCTGVAPGVKIMALRIDFGDVYESAVIEALEYARVNGAAICSMSFGGIYPSEIVEAQCDDVWDNGNGVILLAAAGNEDTSEILYPAGYDSVMSVGGTIPFSYDGEPVDEERLSPDLGYYWGSNYGDWVQVMGYAEHYITTNGEDVNTYYDGVTGEFFGGTSCATPFAAGVMALIRSAFPLETPGWSWNRLLQTADDLDTVGFDTQTANGRVNAMRAVYGPDRFADQEDPLGFVPLDLPNARVFDSIHDVPGNPYQDTRDLYRFTTTMEGFLVIELEIFTWGENLDLAIYRDAAMTELIEDSIGPNHAGDNYESIMLNCEPGQEYFLKVYSPAPGSSTSYGLRVFNTNNELTVTGESLAPDFVHQGGFEIPFLKVTLEIGYQATLDELIFNMHGTLPIDNWRMARLYEDTNFNGVLDASDELLVAQLPFARNRVRLSGLDLTWTYRDPLVLLFAADISQTLGDNLVSFGLESYKDVTTEEGVEAPYVQFPIESASTLVGTDSDPPAWRTTVGIQTVEPLYSSVIVGWNGADDELSPPVKYNIYYTRYTPFDFSKAKKLEDVKAVPGTTTEFRFIASGLPLDVEQHFIVRAEDQAGNEDGNMVILSCTPAAGGDPTHPVILKSFPIEYGYDIALDGDTLVVADGWAGLVVFDRTDPVNLERVATYAEDSMFDVEFDAPYAYCVGWDYYWVLDLTNPSSPTLADWLAIWGDVGDQEGDWAYVTDYDNYLFPIDVSNPHNISQKTGVALPYSGYPTDIDIHGDYIYVAQWYLGVVALNRTNPAAPTVAKTFGSSDVYGLMASNDVLYCVEVDTGALTLYDIGMNPTNPPLLDSSTDGPGTWAERVVLLGDYAYVSRYTYGLVVFDVSDPTDIGYVGDLDLYGAVAMATDGGFIYVCSDEGSLSVVI